MYTLLFPFNIPANMQISRDEFSEEQGSLKFSLIRTSDECKYKLKIEGFAKLSDAENYICKIDAGFKWLTLNKGLPSEYVLESQKIMYVEDGKEEAKKINEDWNTNYEYVDAIIEANKPAIYESGKQIIVQSIEPLAVLLQVAKKDFFTYLLEGISFQHSDTIILDNKLRVAIDLYGAYFTESSDNARFLSLMMAFEALAKGNERPEFVQILIRQWKKQLKNCENKYVEDIEKLHEIESIKGTLAYMKKDSLNKQMYNLVLCTLEENGDRDAIKKADMIKDMYNDRSKLVHTGFLDSKILKQDIRNTKSLIERILRIKFYTAPH